MDTFSLDQTSTCHPKLLSLPFSAYPLCQLSSNFPRIAASHGNSKGEWGDDDWDSEWASDKKSSSFSSSSRSSQPARSNSGKLHGDSPPYTSHHHQSHLTHSASTPALVTPKGGHVDYFAQKGRENEMRPEYIFSPSNSFEQFFVISSDLLVFFAPFLYHFSFQ